MDESTRKIGKYQILGVIGTGSMGVVYKARDIELDRLVALKTLFKISAKSVLSADGIMDRMRAEARFAGNLRHHHIVTVFEIGRDRDTPYIAMDFVEGHGVDSLIGKQGQLPLDVVLRIVSQVASKDKKKEPSEWKARFLV